MGGKRYLYPWILQHFPSNYTSYNYIEPFCGMASVLLNKQPSNIEVLSDLDVGITRILNAVKNECVRFVHNLNYINYEEAVFSNAKKYISNITDDFNYAVYEFVIRRMSRGGLKKDFAWSNRERGGLPGEVNAWETIIKQLPLISQRLQNVTILNENAFDVIAKHDSDNTLYYIDPPYVHTSRVAKKIYQFEMTEEDHIKLSESLNNCKGKVCLSGYPSDLYDRLYKNWNIASKEIANHSGQTKVKQRRNEVLWTNY